MEIRWLHKFGLISSYQDYLDLPIDVLLDARVVMEWEGRQMAAS